MVLLDQLSLRTLSHTAQDPNRQAPFPLLADRVVILNAVEYLLLCIISYRTSIDKHRISKLWIFGQVVTIHLHDRRHDFAIGYVHLAAIGLNINTLFVKGRSGFRVRRLVSRHKRTIK